jgi:hypothetical protein
MNSWDIGMLCEIDAIWQRAQPDPKANDNTPQGRR